MHPRCIAVTLWFVAACGGSPDKAPAVHSVADSARAPTFSTADFRKLDWLEGAWRGQMPNGSVFFESYHRLDDSTIVMGAHTDSTLETRSDSAFIWYRAGTVVHRQGEQTWPAIAIDGNSVEFASPQDRRNHFVWTRHDSSWTASIFSVAPDGAMRTTVFPMTRVR